MSKKANIVPKFQHVPLDDPNKAIRLFTLEPGLPVRGSLHQYPLSGCPSYEAVSYMWGRHSLSSCIMINDRRFLVQSNLFAFLRQLCQQGNRAVLWCDAICIDQDSIFERNHQVQLMGRIYEQATTVLVWLRYQARNDGLDMKDLRLHYKAMVDQRRNDKCWSFFADLCTNQYWTRTWIVQELLLAKDIRIMYDRGSIDWDAFDQIFMLSLDDAFTGTQTRAVTETLERIKKSTFAEFCHDRRLAKSERVYSFETLISKYGTAKCSDVRDRVFGFLGLAHDGNLVEVDYWLEANALWASVMNSYPAQAPAVFGRRLEYCLELHTLSTRHGYGAVEDVDMIRKRNREILLERLELEATPEQRADLKAGKGLRRAEFLPGYTLKRAVELTRRQEQEDEY